MIFRFGNMPIDSNFLNGSPKKYFRIISPHEILKEISLPTVYQDACNAGELWMAVRRLSYFESPFILPLANFW